MDTGKEVLFAMPLVKIFSALTPPGVSVETTTGPAQKKVEFSLSLHVDRVIHMA